MTTAGDDCSSWIMICPIASFQHVAVLARKKLALAGLHYSVGSMRECGWHWPAGRRIIHFD